MGGDGSGRFGGEDGRPERRPRLEEAVAAVRIGSLVPEIRDRRLGEAFVLVVSWREGAPVLAPTDRPPSWTLPQLPADYIWHVDVEPVRQGACRSRWYFRCPRCMRRRTALYALVAGHAFACRVCQDLTYRSAQEWDNLRRTGWYPGRLREPMASAGFTGRQPRLGRV